MRPVHMSGKQLLKVLHLRRGATCGCGCCVQADRGVLFAMPLLQVGMLVFFLLVAVFHFMYSWWLLSLCLCTGGFPILICNLHHDVSLMTHG